MHTVDLSHVVDALRDIASQLQKSDWAEHGAAFCRKYSPLVFCYDHQTRYVVEHLAEELNVRYRAGSSFNRSDRPQIPTVTCSHTERNIFGTADSLYFRFADNILQLVDAGETLSLSLGYSGESLVGLVGRVLMHGMCEWFEPEFDTDFGGSYQLALTKAFLDAADCFQKLGENASLTQYVNESVFRLRQDISLNGMLYIFGNGGSATDSVDIADFGRQCRLPTVHLLEAGYLTCAYNDNHPVFARAFERLKAPHMALGLSTSGASENVNVALEQAKKSGLSTFALCGKDGGRLVKEALAEYVYTVPDQRTQRIQEVQYFICREILARCKRE